MIVTVNSVDQLNSALHTASGGDTILLAPGTYSGLNFSNLSFSSAVTITSQDVSHQAILNATQVNSSSGLNFTNLDVHSDNGSIFVESSSNIHFDGLNIHGPAGSSLINNAGYSGAIIKDSSNVSITNSNFHDLTTASGFFNDNNVTVTGNQFHDIQTDGIDVAGTSNIVISKNVFTNFHPQPADHPDAIQFWAVGAITTGGTNVTISDNLVTRGTGGVIQGIFVGGEVGMEIHNVAITGNAVLGSMWNAISDFSVVGGTISNNIVAGYPDMSTWIRVQTSNGITISNDQTNSMYVTPDNVGVTQSGIVTSTPDPTTDPTTLNNWLAAHPTVAAEYASITGGAVVAPAAASPPVVPPVAPPVVAPIVQPPALSPPSGAPLANVQPSSGGFVTPTGIQVQLQANLSDASTVKTAATSFTLGGNDVNLVLTGTKVAQTGIGNNHDNIIVGNNFHSTLSGGEGNDTLVSVGGADTMTGGSGHDVFQFDAVPANFQTDLVTDFHKGQDVIDLRGVLANYQGNNPIADHWVAIYTNRSGTTIWVDDDGPSGHDHFTPIVSLPGVTQGLTMGTDWVFH